METIQKLERIGRGSFGVVFRCKLIPDGTEAVLKQATVESLDEKEREQAQNEVHVLARLQVPPPTIGAGAWTRNVRARAAPSHHPIPLLLLPRGPTVHRNRVLRRRRPCELHLRAEVIAAARGDDHAPFVSDGGRRSLYPLPPHFASRLENAEYLPEQRGRSQNRRLWHRQEPRAHRRGIPTHPSIPGAY